MKIFKNFKEIQVVRPNYSAEGLYGGRLLGVRSNSFLCFYDWGGEKIIRKIEIAPKAVYWSGSGELLVIACDTNFFILRYHHDKVVEAFNTDLPEDGIEDAFEVLYEINERLLPFPILFLPFPSYSLLPSTESVQHYGLKIASYIPMVTD